MNVILLPGIIAPAALRYAPLLERLPDIQPVLKDLEVYAGAAPPMRYSMAVEVGGVDQAANAAGFERFHLYGHSGGGAVALAYTAAHPERVLSLAVDEPASDFSDADFRDDVWRQLDEAATLPAPQGTRAFLALQLAPGVELPPEPSGPPPPWMATRPAGVRAFITALRGHRVDSAAYAAFDGPVYYSFGSLSNPRWVAMRDRLAASFRDFSAERYDGIHHLYTSHQAEPAKVAQRLRELWGRAEQSAA